METVVNLKVEENSI